MLTNWGGRLEVVRGNRGYRGYRGYREIREIREIKECPLVLLVSLVPSINKKGGCRNSTTTKRFPKVV